MKKIKRKANNESHVEKHVLHGHAALKADRTRDAVVYRTTSSRKVVTSLQVGTVCERRMPIHPEESLFDKVGGTGHVDSLLGERQYINKRRHVV